MKITRYFYPALALGLLLTACDKDDAPLVDAMKPNGGKAARFTVRIENISAPKDYFAAGVFNTPVGATAAGPALPGHAFEFNFQAGKGHRLSLATMFGQSNDLFFAPSEKGIALYREDGTALSGDITNLFYLWDAGTEVNEAPGTGPNQAPRQSGPNTGLTEEQAVRMIAAVNDGFQYPAVADVLKATLTHHGGQSFTLRLAVQPGSVTPLAPGVWVVHNSGMPIFTEGQPDYGMGLEGIAEDGNPTDLIQHLDQKSGLTNLLSPGTWAVHKNKVMLFTEGEADYGQGLEAIAEDGNPAGLTSLLQQMKDVYHAGAFTTPMGAAQAMPAGPGAAYEFSFTATPAQQYLSFATMFVQSNDLFYAPAPEGIRLWNKGQPVNGDVSSQVMLWDAGTEVNEYPGVGMYQAPRQSGPNMGPAEGGSVRRISNVNDGFSYPATQQVIRVTIQSSLEQ